MQAFWRTGSQLIKGLAHWTGPRYHPGTSGELLLHPFQRSSWTPLWTTSAPFCQSLYLKDYGFPNPSWRQEMVEQFEKFTALSKDGMWRKMPNRMQFLDLMPEWLKGGFEERKHSNSRYFLRCVDAEGLGFEFVLFFNASEKRMVALFQPGSYLEGPTGFVHGGALAAILDTTFGGCALYSMGKILTANLNINYKSSAHPAGFKDFSSGTHPFRVI
nr:acyl-coenzyme A thioesterase THEM4-like isoform X2 [Pogona vitticeps]